MLDDIDEDSDFKTCPECDGTGVETIENGVQIDDVCPTCGGDGQVPA